MLLLALQDAQPVYRVLNDKRHIDKQTGNVTFHAFKRRAADHKGLSVDYGCTAAESQSLGENLFNLVVGVAEIAVGDVRATAVADGSPPLDVIEDPDTVRPIPHANIVNVPFWDDTTPVSRAYANRLAAKARPVDTTPPAPTA